MLVQLTVAPIFSKDASPHSSLKITFMYLCLHCILIFLYNLTWLWTLPVAWQIYCIWCEAVFSCSFVVSRSFSSRTVCSFSEQQGSLELAQVMVWGFVRKNLSSWQNSHRLSAWNSGHWKEKTVVLSFFKCSRNSEKEACDNESNVTKLKNKPKRKEGRVI